MFLIPPKKLKGFTLIELLVVIAIIGLLATLILVGVRNARLRANDAKIQTTLSELRNVAEMSYTTNQNYQAVCDEADNTLSNSGDFGKIEIEVKKYNGDQYLTCFESSYKQDYAVSSPLTREPGKHWCVSSVGIAKEIATPITSSTCP